MPTFFHCCPADRDPAQLLDPGRQYTDPWGEPDHGRCDKCEGGGTVLYECLSCREGGSDPRCPACEGRVRFRATCPTCEGSGEITQTRRRGVAVFPTRPGLLRYLAERGAEVENRVVVELEARLSDDRDLDADAGALLAHPERIVAVEPLDPEVVAAIRRRLNRSGAGAASW